jgi:hypothetical protein
LHHGLFEVAGFVAVLFEGGDFVIHIVKDEGDRGEKRDWVATGATAQDIGQAIAQVAG